MLAPEYCRRNVARRHEALANLLARDYDFSLRYAKDCDPENIETDGVDVVINCYSPQFSWPDNMKNLPRLGRGVGLVTYPGDLHWHNKKQADLFLPHMRAMLDRSDVVLIGEPTRFKRTFPKFTGKLEFFPAFFSSHEDFANLPYNEMPVMKAGLPGAIYDSYPFRQYVRGLGHPYVQRVPFSGKRVEPTKGDKTGKAFARELNRFFCCITCPSKFNYVTIKHTEIPAAGALLMSPTPMDFGLMGFIPGEHYLSVGKENFVSVLEDVIGHPEKYEAARKAGRAHVLANHSINNRYKQLTEIINRLANCG